MSEGEQRDRGDDATDQDRLVVLAELLDRELLERARGRVDGPVAHREQRGGDAGQQRGDGLRDRHGGGAGEQAGCTARDPAAAGAAARRSGSAGVMDIPVVRHGVPRGWVRRDAGRFREGRPLLVWAVQMGVHLARGRRVSQGRERCGERVRTRAPRRWLQPSSCSLAGCREAPTRSERTGASVHRDRSRGRGERPDGTARRRRDGVGADTASYAVKDPGPLRPPLCPPTCW